MGAAIEGGALHLATAVEYGGSAGEIAGTGALLEASFACYAGSIWGARGRERYTEHDDSLTLSLIPKSLRPEFQ